MDHDEDLVAAARAGSLAAFESLYDRHRSMVFAVALGVCGNGPDADEVLQETFLRAFRSLGAWRGEGRISSWLYSIAVRTAINWRSRFMTKQVVPPRAETHDPAVEAEEAEESRALTRAIAGLPPQQRIVLTLRHVRGLSLAEIAELQECAIGTVKSNLHHAVARLKESFGRRIRA